MFVRDAQSSASYDYLYKIVIVGDSRTGKTGLLTGEAVSQPTTTASLYSKELQYADKTIKLVAKDIPGCEKYRLLSRGYYPRASAYLVTYDITNKASFRNVANWLADLRGHGESKALIFLVGTKIDQVACDADKRQVENEEAKAFAKKQGICFLGEVSAKEGVGIEPLFQAIGEALYQDSQLLIQKPQEPTTAQAQESAVAELNVVPESSFPPPFHSTAGQVGGVVSSVALIAIAAALIVFYWPVLLAASVAAWVGIAAAAILGGACLATMVAHGADYCFGSQSEPVAQPSGLGAARGTYARLNVPGVFDGEAVSTKPIDKKPSDTDDESLSLDTSSDGFTPPASVYRRPLLSSSDD